MSHHISDINFVSAIAKGLAVPLAVLVLLLIGKLKEKIQRTTHSNNVSEIPNEERNPKYEYSKLNIEQKRLAELTRIQDPSEQRRLKNLKESISRTGVENSIESLISIAQMKTKHSRKQPNNTTGFSKNMSSYEYEKYCARLLSDNNWSADVTSQSCDQGIDIIARKGSRLLAVQCKLYNSNSVGNKAVQEIYAGKGYKDANEAIVITNSTFTKSAKQLARKLNVKLMHHDELQRY